MIFIGLATLPMFGFPNSVICLFGDPYVRQTPRSVTWRNKAAGISKETRERELLARKNKPPPPEGSGGASVFQPDARVASANRLAFGDVRISECPNQTAQLRLSSAKKSLPLSSMTMKAGKSTTSIFQTASMPSSGNSTRSTFLMQSRASRAAGPPIEPR